MHLLNELSPIGNGRNILNRYGYYGSLDEQPVLSFCSEKGIDMEFVQALWETFQSQSEPDAERFARFDIHLLLDYLEHTHSYYRDKLLPEIELALFQIIQVIGVQHPLAGYLLSRFTVYRIDLTRHIEEEEATLFAHARKLTESTVGLPHYSAEVFEEEHIHHEDMLEDLLTVLEEELENKHMFPYRMFMNKVELLQRDLTVHAFVEDHVLLPRIALLEK